MPTVVPLSSSANQSAHLYFDSNLPDHFIGSVQATCQYRVLEQDRYYLLEYHLTAPIKYVCQRCMEESEMTHDVSNVIAICNNEQDAEQLINDYEPIVIKGRTVELELVILDELHLSAPLKHPTNECAY